MLTSSLLYFYWQDLRKQIDFKELINDILPGSMTLPVIQEKGFEEEAKEEIKFRKILLDFINQTLAN